jgi:hypothetical protein
LPKPNANVNPATVNTTTVTVRRTIRSALPVKVTIEGLCLALR